MYDIATRRLRLFPLTRGAGFSQRQMSALLNELAALGYRVDDLTPLLQADPACLTESPAILRTLSTMRGADRDWVPLFSGFPDAVPEENEYFARRLTGFFGSMLRLFKGGETLETGVTVPEWLFDLKDFGADPVTQMQTRALFEQGRAAQAAREGDGHVEWIGLTFVFEDEVEERLLGWLESALYSRSSLSEGVRGDLSQLLARFGVEAIDSDQIVLKETLAFALRCYWERGDAAALAQLTRSATDLLRLFALLTDTDVSLATSIRYPRFTRAQRRAVLGALEGCPRLIEDLNRHRGLWLQVARGLHVGEYAARYPVAYEAFSQLRAGPAKSFDSVTEALICEAQLSALLAHLSRRPGAFVRRLHELLRRFSDDTDAILEAFDGVADRVPLKSLLVLEAHLATINDRPRRAIVNKRGALRVLLNPTQQMLTEDQLQATREVLEAAMLRQLAQRDSMAGQSVYVEPALAGATVPLQQREASDGLIALGRGSRIPVDLSKTLRLFVYWRQTKRRTDLDLSAATFDADMNYLGHVSYTQLKGDGLVHSGDIQSAPHGASEFIDVTFSSLPEGVRYLAPQIYRFCGEDFNALAESFVGWMLREEASKDRASFDPKTVQEGYTLRGSGAYAMPLVVDIARSEIVLVDLCVRGLTFNNTVEGACGNVAVVIRELLDFTRTRPTMARLAELHVRARGGRLVEAPEGADASFLVRGGTWSASDAAQVLSELL